MIKTKMIQDGASYCDDRLDTKINDFIEKNNIKDNVSFNDVRFIDIKFTSVNNRATALIIYEVEEDE